MSAHRVTYLVSQYPAANHTYLLGEILGLRSLGWSVRVVSVREPDRDRSLLSETETREVQNTSYLLRVGAIGLCVRALKTVVRRPKLASRVLLLAAREAIYGEYGLSEFAYAVEALAAHERLIPFADHVHGHFVGQALVYLDVLRGGNWSVTIHGPEELAPVHSRRLSRLIQRASFVRFISQYGADHVAARCSDAERQKLVVNRLGVTAVADERIEKAVVPRRRTRILTVGRLSKIKAQDLLIQAVKELQERDLHVDLEIIGDGELRSSLEQQIESLSLRDQVRIAGWKSPAAVASSMREADLFVLPSSDEGIPLVLMEAISVGCPCIATAVGGVRELIQNEETGLVVSPGNVDEIVCAINTLIRDPSKAERLALRARERLKEHFDLRKNVAELANCLSRYAS